MHAFAELCEEIAGTTKKLEKTALVSTYLRSLPATQASVVAVFLSGRPFPIWEETTLQAGGSLLWRVISELSGKTETHLYATYRHFGDLGTVAAEVLPANPPGNMSPLEVQKTLREIAAAHGPATKAEILRSLLSQLSPLEAKYIVKIITGDLRIGLKENLVEEAIARAYDAQLSDVQRANMLLGDIGETLCLVAAGKLSTAQMRLFHPLGFMLASPAANSVEALSYFNQAWVEDKYDGIRAQAHCSEGEVRIFSRTRDDISESFPEIADALSGLPGQAILDGEIVAWSYLTEDPNGQGRALPFSALQQRLGRKKVSEVLKRKVPVAYLAFDVLYANGELLIDRPLHERGTILEKLLSQRKPGQARSREAQSSLIFEPEPNSSNAQIIRAPVSSAGSTEELDQLFDAARARGNEGLMIKDPGSAYTPGRRGKAWLKLKRELATLDVVVTAVEYGHGKRIGVLSDYTFAVWNGDELANIGKAYSGLTDAEIAEMTKWFLAHTVEDQGFRLAVEPRIVLEVAFNNMMRSDRHNSGYALRFPRIVRLRPDKAPEDADTIERVKEIFEKQSK